MAVKGIILGEPKYFLTSSYNFEDDYTTNPPNYNDSIGLPESNDKFQKKDLYSSFVPDRLNEKIIEGNIKFDGGGFVRIDKLVIDNAGVSYEIRGIDVRGYIFSSNTYNPYPDLGSYSRLISELEKDNKRFFKYTPGNLNEGRGLGSLKFIEGEEIVTDIGGSPNDGQTANPGDYANLDDSFDPRTSLTIAETATDVLEGYDTTVFDETINNFIFIAIYMKGDADRWWGADKRKRRIQVFSIDNKTLFNSQQGGQINTITPREITNVSGNGGGGGAEAAALKVTELSVTIDTMPGTSNTSAVESQYGTFIPLVQPPITFEPNEITPLSFFSIGPDRQLDNSQPSGDSTPSEIFLDFYPITNVGVANELGQLEDNFVDLQSYYNNKTMPELSDRASAPATVTFDLRIIDTNFNEFEGNFIYFVIDWDDRDNNIKTIQDFTDNRPTTEFELLELQEQGLYQFRRRIQGYPGTGGVNATEFTHNNGDIKPFTLLPLWPDTLAADNYLLSPDADASYDGFSSALVRPMYGDPIEPVPEFIQLLELAYMPDDYRAGTLEILSYTDGGRIDGLCLYQTGTNLWIPTYYLNSGISIIDSMWDAAYNMRLLSLTVSFEIESDVPDTQPVTEYGPELTHTYTTPGIKTIKTIIFSHDSPENDNQVGRWKLITSRFFLDIPRNQYPDFGELGGSGYVTLPWPYTTPIIGGVSEDSRYKRSVRGVLSSGTIGDTDIIDERFLVNDLENDEMGQSINLMDLEQARYFNNSYSIHDLLGINPIIDGGFIPYYRFDYWDALTPETTFPMESSVGQIFISDNLDLDLVQSCQIELNTGNLVGKSIYDSSGNSNDGFLMGDYKIKKTAKGTPMRRDSTIKFPKKTGNSEGAL